MKTYKLVLFTGRTEFVQADRYDREGDLLLFYRNDVAVAEFATSLVRKVVEPTPPGRGPGVIVAITLCVMYFGIFMSVGFFFWSFRQDSFQLPNRYLPLLVQLPVAWSITLWRGLRWRSLWWRKLSFREACPLTRFPIRILPALLVATFGATILAQGAANSIPPHPMMEEGLDSEVFFDGWILMIITLVLMAPIGEELFFRGLLLHGFLVRYSRPTAVVASAVLFALFHLNVWQAAFALPIGLACGWLFLRTGSLIPGMICHILANFSSTFLLPPLASIMRRTSSPLTEWAFMPASMMALATALVVFGGIVLWWQLRKLPGWHVVAGN